MNFELVLLFLQIVYLDMLVLDNNFLVLDNFYFEILIYISNTVVSIVFIFDFPICNFSNFYLISSRFLLASPVNFIASKSFCGTFINL